jgi:hypothetical protein
MEMVTLSGDREMVRVTSKERTGERAEEGQVIAICRRDESFEAEYFSTRVSPRHTEPSKVETGGETRRRVTARGRGECWLEKGMYPTDPPDCGEAMPREKKASDGERAGVGRAVSRQSSVVCGKKCWEEMWVEGRRVKLVRESSEEAIDSCRCSRFAPTHHTAETGRESRNPDEVSSLWSASKGFVVTARSREVK